MKPLARPVCTAGVTRSAHPKLSTKSVRPREHTTESVQTVLRGQKDRLNSSSVERIQASCARSLLSVG